MNTTKRILGVLDISITLFIILCGYLLVCQHHNQPTVFNTTFQWMEQQIEKMKVAPGQSQPTWGIL